MLKRSPNTIKILSSLKSNEKSDEKNSVSTLSQVKSGNRIKSSILDSLDVRIVPEDDPYFSTLSQITSDEKNSIDNGVKNDEEEVQKLKDKKKQSQNSQKVNDPSQNQKGVTGSSLSQKGKDSNESNFQYPNLEGDGKSGGDAQPKQNSQSSDISKQISSFTQNDQNAAEVSRGSKRSRSGSSKIDIPGFSAFFSQEYVQNMMMLMSVMALMLVLKTFLQSFECLSILSNSPLKEAIYILFREVVVVLIGAVIIEALNYYEVFDFSWENSIGVTYCILMTLFLWTVLGLILVCAAHRHVERWKQLEQLSQDQKSLEKFKHQYESVYYRDQNLQGGPKFEKDLIEKIKYFIMRTIFIHPIFLPPLNESFLRKDFNFSKYLAHAYAKTLKQFFNTSWVSFFFIIILIDMTKMIYGYQPSSSVFIPLINLLPPIFFTGVFLTYLINFTKIERQLYPHIRDQTGVWLKPEEINFQESYDIIDPFVLFDTIPQPEYLELEDHDNEESLRQFENASGSGGPEERYSRRLTRGGSPERRRRNKFDQDEEESSSMMQRESASRRSEDSEVRIRHIQEWEQEDQKQKQGFCGLYLKESEYGNIPNRHERLFIGGRNGIPLARVSLQVFYLLSLIYASTYVVFSVEQIYQHYKHSDRSTFITLISILIICPIAMATLWILTIPQILSKLTMITNVTLQLQIRLQIEMMKDKELIQKVISEQKLERAQRSYRIFQVLKLIRREMALELKQHIKDKRMRGFTKKQLVEQFQLLEAQPSHAVKGNAIKTLIRLCGQELSNQEKNIMLKKAHSKGDQLKYQDLSLAVEMILNDVKVDPYYLVFNLFQLFFKGEEKVEYSQFITFFGEFVTYFDEEDISGFLKEVQYIKRGSDEIQLQELASMIRDDVELFPK